MKSVDEAARIVQNGNLAHELRAWKADVQSSESCLQLIHSAQEIMSAGPAGPLAALLLCLIAGINIGIEMEKG
jgi:hypothetical protein